MFSMKLIQTKGKRQLAIPVDLLRLSPTTNLSENPLLGLDLGGCIPLEWLDNLPSPPHILQGALGMIHLVLTTLWTNQKGQTIKDVA